MESQENIAHIRHSLAHLLAAAVKELYPDAQHTIGPATDHGFYYDFAFTTPLSETDLPKIEKKMRQILKTWQTFDCKEVSEAEALEFFKENKYKTELIKEFAAAGQTLTFYTSGDFTDLCEGGHVESARSIKPDAFKLSHLAGAYWRGDEKNDMLTRIYGYACHSKEELAAFIEQQEEAKKRDHRKLGKEMDLFTFSGLVGPGLPLWTPRGTLIRHLLDQYIWELRENTGYERVTIPHITKKDLYETSGHWEKFGDELFRIKTREGKEFAMKPMNCPHHSQIFDRQPHSYRDMPQRYAETTMVYRDEQSGELGGLTRVLSITQDDSHVFCRHEQVKQEFFSIWDMIDTFYGSFEFTLRVRLSFHNPETMEKYLGTKEVWEHAETAIREIAEMRQADYFEAPGEAALYGPKLDFMAKDSLGREHQVATIQYDMNLPERFDLHCINETGEKERVVMIHCAIMGSIERFMAVLIEHLGGNFPLWLSPVQVKVLPIGEVHEEYAEEVYEELMIAGIRADLDDDDDTLGKRIRKTKLEKVPYFVVIGDEEIKNQHITLESRDREDSEKMSVNDLVAKLQKEISNKT